LSTASTSLSSVSLAPACFGPPPPQAVSSSKLVAHAASPVKVLRINPSSPRARTSTIRCFLWLATAGLADARSSRFADFFN
jgi:hypothetical protein